MPGPVVPSSPTPSGARFVPWVGGTVAALLGLGLAVLLYSRFGDGGTRVAVRSYEVLSDSAVRIDFSVTKDEAATVVCTLRARDRTGEEIGTALLRVGPSQDGSVLVSHELVTTSRANTGEVLGCTDAPDVP